MEEKATTFIIKFCPHCSNSLQDRTSIANEYWQGNDTVYFCWCSHCTWTGEIVLVKKITAPELV